MKEDLTDITVLLDRSGSMDQIRKDTIGGFNTFLEDQKKQPGQAVLSLVQFDDRYEPNYEGIPIRDAKDLNAESYQPRGSTALLDSLGKTIVKTGERLDALKEEDRPGKVIFVVITDGLENASKEFKKAQIAEKIKAQQDQYSWNFVFLGANIDSFSEAGGMNFVAGNVMDFKATGKGVKAAFACASDGMTKYRSSGSKKTSSYFSGGKHAGE